MPTTRPRITVTETPDLERRLDRAASRFPELAGRRRELLLRLTEIGERQLDDLPDTNRREAAKRRILARTTSLTDAEAMLAARDAEWSHELDW